MLSRLRSAGIHAEGVRRGLDHGVFAPFKVAFDPDKNPLNVPIVQVSLFDSDDPDQHYRLGQAVAGLRNEGVQIIVSGMAVHNLRDLWASMGRPGAMPYTLSFDQALKDAVETNVSATVIFAAFRSLALNKHSRRSGRRLWLSCSSGAMHARHILLSSTYYLCSSAQVPQAKTEVNDFGRILKGA